jgi:hypothetical protein
MDSAPDLHQLSCEDVDPLLPLAADGAIDAASDPAVFAHLARCCDCQESLARHDLISLALESGRGQPRREQGRGWHYRLPWPAAAAALVAMAVTAGWAANRPAAPGQPVAKAPDFQVQKVLDGRQGHPVYTVWRDGKMMIIDLQAVDGASSSESREVHPVDNKFSAP